MVTAFHYEVDILRYLIIYVFSNDFDHNLHRAKGKPLLIRVLDKILSSTEYKMIDIGNYAGRLYIVSGKEYL
jgi:hypothetical protein